MKKNITLLFDFDGTIVDSIQVVKSIIEELAPLYNLKINAFTLEDLKEKGAKDIIKLIDLKWWKLPLFVFHVKRKMVKNMHKIELFNQIKSEIIFLHNKGYRIEILSSNNRETIQHFLENNNMTPFVAHIYKSSALFKKHTLLNKIKGATTNQLLYIGDEVRDIEACKKSNVPIVAVTWGYNSAKILNKSKPEYIIEKPNQLSKVINDFSISNN
ncbi:HAD hydrolase-like protein [Flammeovirga kamogawensis]|uniref:HAD hydrolase-like protein n=1 Tax=Flammeovirga kamogawensis TaxID=373891 RepID=A0ABX8GWP1_9BACT|nr:HAD hydrolase-like protein [Flammeovirga kamogawensis]MBB6461275.1 phosphoglycolate phosphatase-like HAD superfamily hydrolase [Flammeovirga kamogawensis]QWG07834.1 HAD hydrolase-like protein [Flammeovirga kamogawensis]TRX69639.1 hypothetical protein EO216_16450 [Flammeovirga kamogawensis]